MKTDVMERPCAGSSRAFVTSVVLMLFGFCTAAHAATLFVDGNTGNDQGGGNSCTSAANPCATIQQAIDSSLSGDTIQIADAFYTEAIEINRTLTLQGQSRIGTVIQADNEPFQGNYDINDDRVVTVSGGSELQIFDLTIRHGVSTSGGGLEIDGVDLVLGNVLFDRNGAGNRAGGLRTENNLVTMNNVLFVGNLGGQTPGVSEGGAIYARNATMNLTDVRFEINQAGSGAGIFTRDVNGLFERVDFIANAAEGEGGGLALRSSSPDLVNVSFRGNSAGGDGGAIYTVFDSAPDLTNVLIAGNVAGSTGGGISFQSGSSQTRILTNVTMTGNRAEASRGGAIFKPGDLELRNCIIWNNSDINGQGSPTSSLSESLAGVTSQFSLVQGYTAGELAGSGSLDGTNPANNPVFVTPVSPVGAPTAFGNLRLREASPLIDIGNNSYLTGTSTDLDGLTRINNGIVDLGPFEFGNDGLFQDRFEF